MRRCFARPIDQGLRSEGIPDPKAEVSHCVHHIALHPARPDVLFMQKHWDIMRSDDGGDSWREVSGNLPTDFGFPIDIHGAAPRRRRDGGRLSVVVQGFVAASCDERARKLPSSFHAFCSDSSFLHRASPDFS